MQKFVKGFSLAISAALCIGMLTQYNLENTKADSSSSDIDYAIGMMGSYATFTGGDFHDNNHSMAPVAVGGNVTSDQFMMTDNRSRGCFESYSPDFVIGGEIKNSTGKLALMLGSKNGNKDFTVAVKDGNIDSSNFTALYNDTAEGNQQVQSTVKKYYDFEFPVDFDKAMNGFKALSSSIDNYATADDSNAINVDVKYGKAELIGTSEYNVFNLSSGDFSQVVLYVPVNSHNIVNFPGNNTNYVTVDLNYISNVKDDGKGNITFDSTEVVLPSETGEESLYNENVIYLNQNLVFNAYSATELADFTNGSILAPNARVHFNGNTNGAVICNSFSSEGGAEFHGANMGGSFTWLKNFDIEITTDVVISKIGVSGDYNGTEIPGAELYLSGIDFNGNPIDMSKVSLQLGKGADTNGQSSAKIGWISGTEATTVKGLGDGVYTLTEYAAPNGYNVTTDIFFTIKDGNVYDGASIVEQNKLNDSHVTMFDNAWTNIKISKIAVGGDYDGTELPGARLVLNAVKFDDANTKFTFSESILEKGEGAKFDGCTSSSIAWISGTTPTFVNGLPNGSYTLVEDRAPEGYQVTTNISFDIKDGKVSNIKDIIDTDSNHIGMFDEAIPTPEPTVEITPEPTVEITPEPTVEITPEPTVEITPEPTVEITPEPTVEITPEPTVEITPEPTVEITPEPTVEITPEPTVEITPEPTVEITPEPTVEITPEPTVEITPEPTVEITPEPTVEITPEPTVEITPEPTVEVTPEPTPEVVVEAAEEPLPTPTIPPTDSVLVVDSADEPTPVPTKAPVEPTAVPTVRVERIVPAVDVDEDEETTPAPTATPEVTATPTEEVTPTPTTTTVTVENPPAEVTKTTPDKPEKPAITSTGESTPVAMILGWSSFSIAALIFAVEIIHKKVSKKNGIY
ncbi:MAG: hypothetical protein K6G47_04010 [Clostridia bacterium]|nr:hypothetical protein [Clostridia bacterium]